MSASPCWIAIMVPCVMAAVVTSRRSTLGKARAYSAASACVVVVSETRRTIGRDDAENAAEWVHAPATSAVKSAAAATRLPIGGIVPHPNRQGVHATRCDIRLRPTLGLVSSASTHARRTHRNQQRCD